MFDGPSENCFTSYPVFPVRFLPLLSVALASIIAPAMVLAQQPGRVIAPPPPLPVPATSNPAMANRPVALNPLDPVRVQFPNSQVLDVLEKYQDLTGKHVLADQNVNGPINIVINEQVTREEAIKIIETQLNLNGFPLVPSGDNIVKVLGVGKQVRSAGVPLFFDLSAVPDSEQTVSFLLRLRYLDAAEIASQLGQYILPGNNNGFTPLQKSGAIIITETATSVRRLVNLITQLDVPAAPVVEKFIRLERADASKAVEFLNGVFETKSSGTAGGQPGGVAAPGVPGNNPNRRSIRRVNEDGQPVLEPAQAPLPGTPGLIALSGDSIIQGRITLTPDVRTNRIHVVTSPVNMPLVEKLIGDYDANTPFASPVRRPLRFVNARDVLPILIQALSEPGTEGNGANSGGSAPTSRPPQSNTNQNSNNLFGNSSSGSNGLNSSGSSDNSIGSESLNTQPVDTTPTEATVGTTKIIADPRSNTIILLGNAEAKDKVAKVLDQLDVRAPQVVIRVVIGELSLGKNTEFGANYLLSRSRGAFGSNFNGTAAFPGATPSTTTTTTTDANGNVTTTPTTAATTTSSVLSNLTSLAAGLPSGFSGGVAGIISVTKGFDIILSALEATNRFKTVNRPVLFTSNNKKATIISGQEIAVPTNSLSTATTTVGSAALQTNVEFKTVALQLEVVPLINSDKEVTLDIVQKLDSVVAGSGTAVGGTNVPTIAKREIKSTVSMPNGATVILGGLITLERSEDGRQCPHPEQAPAGGTAFSDPHAQYQPE